MDRVEDTPMKSFAAGMSAVACALLWALGALPAVAQEEAPPVAAQSFLRGDEDTASSQTRKLIKCRDTLVSTVEWQQDQLQIADAQRRVQQTQDQIAAARAKLDENREKLAKLEALLTPQVKADKPDLYTQTEAALPELRGAIAQAEAQLQLHEAKLNADRARITAYMTANPPSAQKHTSAADHDTYERLGKDVLHLYKQARYIIRDYGYAKGTDQSKIEAADPADLMMAPNGRWKDSFGADAFIGQDTVAAYLKKVWAAQKAAGFSEQDVETAKKMVIAALVRTTQYQALAIDDAALQAETTTKAEAMGDRILAQSRVTVQDLNTMYDLLIDTVDATYR
jgi:hypothetical protein